MKVIKLSLAMLLCFLMVHCKKDPYNSIYNIRYEVRVLPKNQASIKYHSDLYHQNKELKEIIINDSTNIYYNNTWFASRQKPAVSEAYFIEVNFTKYDNPDKVRHGVFVFVNDTSLIDSFTTVTQPASIILSGKIPESIN